MRFHKKFINQSLDSLLDTMTNVVGVLLIILIIIILIIGSDSSSNLLPKAELGNEDMSQIEQETEKLDAILEKHKIEYESLMKIFPSLDLQRIIEQRKREKNQLEEKIAQAQKEINKLQIFKFQIFLG